MFPIEIKTLHRVVCTMPTADDMVDRDIALRSQIISIAGGVSTYNGFGAWTDEETSVVMEEPHVRWEVLVETNEQVFTLVDLFAREGRERNEIEVWISVDAVNTTIATTREDLEV